jgi:hypothetical protein
LSDYYLFALAANWQQCQTEGMGDWTGLSEDERNEIKQKLLATLKSLGIMGATGQWNKPEQLPHWQLVIETSWCDRQFRSNVLRVTEQAMARADIQAPIGGVILKSHKKDCR